MFSRGTATPLPVDEGRDKLQLPPKADPGGVSLRPPETKVANADATAVRAVSPGTYKRPAGRLGPGTVLGEASLILLVISAGFYDDLFGIVVHRQLRRVYRT